MVLCIGINRYDVNINKNESLINIVIILKYIASIQKNLRRKDEKDKASFEKYVEEVEGEKQIFMITNTNKDCYYSDLEELIR